MQPKKKKKAPAVLVTRASLNLLEQEPECHPQSSGRLEYLWIRSLTTGQKLTKCRDVWPVVSVSVMVVSVLELGGGVAPSWKGVCGSEFKKKVAIRRSSSHWILISFFLHTNIYVSFPRISSHLKMKKSVLLEAEWVRTWPGGTRSSKSRRWEGRTGLKPVSPPLLPAPWPGSCTFSQR